MTLVIRLIAKYALWVYILCGLGMVFYLRAALAARREGTQAMFSLERESATGRVYRSSGMILLLLLIVIGVYGLSYYIEVPLLNTDPFESPPPLIETKTPTKQPKSTTASEPTPAPEPTPTRRPIRTPVALPTTVQGTPTVQVLPADCPRPNVQVLQPGQNQVIDAGVQVRGTASKELFDRYEFKFQSRDKPDEWHWIETFKAPVENGDLGFWHTSHLPPGNYRFMLIVIDERGNSEECTVPVVIRH